MLKINLKLSVSPILFCLAFSTTLSYGSADDQENAIQSSRLSISPLPQTQQEDQAEIDRKAREALAFTEEEVLHLSDLQDDEILESSSYQHTQGNNLLKTSPKDTHSLSGK